MEEREARLGDYYTVRWNGPAGTESQPVRIVFEYRQAATGSNADVLVNTDLLDPGATGEIKFEAPAAGTYQFVCTFPGHGATMFGDFVVTP